MLPQAPVRFCDDGDFDHRVKCCEKSLDLLCAYVLASPDDDVRQPVRDRQIAVLVYDSYVACAIPTIGVEDRGGQVRIGVAHEAVRPPAPDLAVLPELYLDPGQCTPIGAMTLRLRLGEQAPRYRRMLCAPVRTERLDSQRSQAMHEGRRNRRPAQPRERNERDKIVAPIRMVEQARKKVGRRRRRPRAHRRA